METMQQVQALRQQAQRSETPCGDGALVWHDWGPPAGRPVLLLHGGAGSWTHWVRNIQPLVDAGYHVLVPDLPGFGESAEPPDGQDADVLPGWLELGLSRLLGETPVTLIGFSFGALVGGLWAQAHPARAARLVLVGSPALSAERLAPLDLQRWDRLPAGAERLAAHRHNLLQLMLAQQVAASALAVALHADNTERDRLRQRRLMLTDALVPVLAGLHCPLHGIWGEQDVLYRHRLPLIEQVLSRAPKFVSLDVLADAGHWVQFEAATAFNQALLAALGKPTAAAKAATS
jgi:pimeloyl-ACP methyl ester carboxylesterase